MISFNPITTAVFFIYPLLVASGLATFGFEIESASGMFWGGLFFGNLAIIVGRLKLVKMFDSIDNGLFSGGFATVFGTYGTVGIAMSFLMDLGAGQMFISLLITLAVIIITEYKRKEKGEKENEIQP